MNTETEPNVEGPSSSRTKAPQRPRVSEAVAPTPPPAGPEDDRVEALIRRAQSGDRRAFEALLAQVRPRAMAVALRVLRNPDDAEDAVQDAFVKIWRYLGRFEGRSSFTTWVHRIVMNASLDLVRRQSCRPAAAVDEEPGREREVVEMGEQETPEEQLLQAARGQVVRAALEVLSPVHRQAITLREFDDCSYDEIAAAAGCPVGTIMSRLHHARRKLADELRGRLAEPAEMACAA